MDKLGRTLEQAKTADAGALAKTVETGDSRPDATTPVAVAPVEDAPVPVPSDPGVRRPGAPTHIGRYVILRTLGEGGMGVVYAAYDEELDRKVAVKLIRPSMQGNSQIRTRILREAQALARVSAPNVVTVYQVGEVDGQLFIAMEFVNGTTLAKWQTETRRPWPEILRMYLAAGQGLLAAHQSGLVHRDFKPDEGASGRGSFPTVPSRGTPFLVPRVRVRSAQYGPVSAGPGA